MSEPNFNRVLLTGTLVSEPELRESPTAGSVCFLRLRCSSVQRLPGGEEHRVNELPVLAIGPHAAEMRPHLHNGCGVIVQGWLECASWELADGRERETLSVIAEHLQLLAPQGARGAARHMPIGEEDRVPDTASVGWAG